MKLHIVGIGKLLYWLPVTGKKNAAVLVLNSMSLNLMCCPVIECSAFLKTFSAVFIFYF